MVIQVYPAAVAVFFFQIRPFLWQNMGMDIYFQILLLIRRLLHGAAIIASSCLYIIPVIFE